eukprot:symbB.v1.2.033320.t1/scaffold4122.1/size44328/1
MNGITSNAMPVDKAGSADVIEDEVPRPKRKAKAKKVREGANVRKEETPNPWATRIRSCGKAKDLEGALQAVEEEDFSCVYFHNVPFEDLLPLFERAGAVRAMRLFRLGDGRSRGQELCQFTGSGAARLFRSWPVASWPIR